MKRYVSFGLSALLATCAFGTAAGGNVEMGRAKAIYCASCHGAAGERELSLWTGGSSRLAGMDPGRIVGALKAYRLGQRFHPMMQFFVMPMSRQDMDDIAAYYSSLGPTLFQRLGGKDAINAVVRELLAAGLADPRLSPRMSKMDAARCERQLTDLLCMATGGPCQYKGRDMKTAHTGANVTETEWQAFAENLVKTFDRFQVPARERADLLNLVGPMKADIVGR